MTLNGTQQERDLDFQGIRVLVTGADGFIGSHLCEALIERGAIVTALCMYNSFEFTRLAGSTSRRCSSEAHAYPRRCT